jgi:RNA polymerase sigma-70 factor (ECF subfamily)
MSETELLPLLRNGDLDAFDALMRRYQRLVYTVAYGFVRHADAARDVTQNVFLKAFRHRGALREDSNVKAWLTRIAYHESLNWRRGNRRHIEGHRDFDQLDTEPAGMADPEGDALGRERLALIGRALLELHPRYRLALTLRYRRGEPIRSIAEALACSEGAAKTLLSRALSQLRQHVATLGSDSGWTVTPHLEG